MRSFWTLFTLSALLALAPVDGVAQCYRCDDCDDVDGHRNVSSSFVIVGNLDGAHACYIYSCEAMFAQGIHQPEYTCQSFAAHEAARDVDHMDEEAAVRLAVGFPQHVRFTEDRRAVQVLSCDGSAVLSQFRIRERSTI